MSLCDGHSFGFLSVELPFVIEKTELLHKLGVCAYKQGAVVTQIRALVTPQPMREMRVKGQYVHHKEIKGAQGVKIVAQGMETVLAGTTPPS